MANKEAEVICISYTVPIVCNSFGVQVRLDNFKIIVTNLTPCDLNNVKRQADTFMDDRRKLSMRYVND